MSPKVYTIDLLIFVAGHVCDYSKAGIGHEGYYGVQERDDLEFH